ncbi:MFS transporter [Cardinium endosymbiont of Nabis limbatus]|uniref:MFS transporter n=1 Tax=Cardinium endosymbiont of Nabis limbatus TaxID=3066217 RepID=UPI003AF3E05F
MANKSKSLILSILVTVTHYYDYYLFGLLVAQISEYFLPKGDPNVQLMKVYFMMAIAYCAKPIGALILGRIGDIYGRASAFTLGLLATSVASLLMAILPSYEKIGMLASFAMLVTRMIICAATSSGSDGVRIYVYEKLNKKYQGLGAGLVAASTLCGAVIAACTVWIFSLNMFPRYSWRIAFALGAFLSLIVLMINKGSALLDDDVVKNNNYHKYKNISILKIIGENFRLFIVAVLLAGSIGSSRQFITVFFPTYASSLLLYVDVHVMRFYNVIGSVVEVLFCIIGGYLIDLFGKKRIATISALCLLLATMMMSYMINTGYISINLYFLICAVFSCLYVSGLLSFTQFIPSAVRYRLFNLAHAVGSIIISGSTAFFAALLYKANIVWLPMVYYFVIILIMIGTIYLTGLKVFRKSISN